MKFIQQSLWQYVVVNGECKLLVLNRNDFMRILGESPDVLKRMRNNLIGYEEYEKEKKSTENGKMNAHWSLNEL